MFNMGGWEMEKDKHFKIEIWGGWVDQNNFDKKNRNFKIMNKDGRVVGRSLLGRNWVVQVK